MASLAAIDERFAAHLAARETVKPAARGPRLLPPLVCRGHRRQPRAAAGGRRPPGSARASQEEAWPDAGRRDEEGGAVAERAAQHRARERASRGSSTPRSPRPGSSSSTGPGRCRRGGGPRRRRLPGRSSGRSASSRWRRTRCEVRFTDPASDTRLDRAGHRGGRVLHLAQSRRRPQAAGPDRVGRRAVAHHAGAQDPGVDRRAGQDPHLRRGRHRHRRGGRGRGGRAAAEPVANASRCSASRTCRRSPPTGRAHFSITKAVRQGRTSTRRGAAQRRRHARRSSPG